MNTQHTEPAGQLPPDYIDTEHTGSSRELLRIFYTACLSEGGTADEVTLRGLRAAIAADRVQRQPVPPEQGEVQELVKWLREQEGWMGACAMYSRIADLLAQRYPQPVPPEPGEVQELVRVLHQAADNDEWDGASPEWCASLTRAADLLAQRYPQPVPVSERLPGDDLCWWFEADEDCGYGSNWTLLRIRGSAIGYTHWLPAHALPLPVVARA